MRQTTKSGAAPNAPISLLEVFGLKPLRRTLRQAKTVLLGTPYQPANLWGPSSLRIFKPWISIPTWLGHRRRDRRVPVYNFFNRVRPPRDAGYSVRVTYARDFRGGRWTYDGHNGTDFAVPVGTTVVAGAPGLVVRVENDFQHGGLKVCIDHGRGLFTTSSHLARPLVRVGEHVARGQPVGLSGASGLDLFLFFPWVAPHLHYNVWLNGEPIDPFALPNSDEASMWRSAPGGHPAPVPWGGEPVPRDDHFAPSVWDSQGVAAATDAARDPDFRARVHALDWLPARAAEVLFARNYRPAMFTTFPPLYAELGERRPCLDLPFARGEVTGVALPT